MNWDAMPENSGQLTGDYVQNSIYNLD